MLLILSFGLMIIRVKLCKNNLNVLREIMYILMVNKTKFKGYD